jgi:hypothetical protein
VIDLPKQEMTGVSKNVRCHLHLLKQLALLGTPSVKHQIAMSKESLSVDVSAICGAEAILVILFLANRDC